MTGPAPERLFAASEATWPPAARWQEGAVTLRDGAGGGKRVSAATAEEPLAEADLFRAEAAMRERGETPLFMVRGGQTGLDATLAGAGYAVVDPVSIYCTPIGTIATETPPRVTMFTLWEPLRLQYDIWRDAGIGPDRWAVMDRAASPRTSLLARWNDHPAGTGFAAIHDRIAVVHAVEILPHQRRQGVARWMMRAAAHWARAEGAEHMAVLCTRANGAACGLYSSLGMRVVGQYHYRTHPRPE